MTPKGHQAKFARDPLLSYFDDCQKIEIHILYLHYFRNDLTENEVFRD